MTQVRLGGTGFVLWAGVDEVFASCYRSFLFARIA